MWAILGQKEQIPELEWYSNVSQTTTMTSVLETLCWRQDFTNHQPPAQAAAADPLATSTLPPQHPKMKRYGPPTSHGPYWNHLPAESPVKSPNHLESFLLGKNFKITESKSITEPHPEVPESGSKRITEGRYSNKKWYQMAKSR